jgi:hypothetical protein
MGERRGAFRVLVAISERKRPPGKSRRIWENNIKMGLQEAGCGSGIKLAEDRYRWRAFVNAVMNFRVPYNTGNFLTS